MYIPTKFQQEDTNDLKSMMAKYPFATLISHSDSGIEVEHIPLFLDEANEKHVLQGHIAKTNPLWKNVKDKSEILIIFNGPNCYISPNYYPSKQENGKAVPTWNYTAVHVKGVVSYIHDDKWKLAMLNNLTDLHEAKQAVPWSIKDAPQEYIFKMLSAIVGLEIDILSITGKWKVSQNQSQENKRGLLLGLSQETDSNAHKIAELVQEHMST